MEEQKSEHVILEDWETFIQRIVLPNGKWVEMKCEILSVSGTRISIQQSYEVKAIHPQHDPQMRLHGSDGGEGWRG